MKNIILLLLIGLNSYDGHAQSNDSPVLKLLVLIGITALLVPSSSFRNG